MKKIHLSLQLKFLVLVVVLAVPTFIRMLQPGIFSMQDFHYFRLYEFSRCVVDGQIPCRWAQDVGLGFGEPLFNFYGQLSYVIGEVFHLVSYSLVDSLKLVFILSLVLSAVSMFFLAKQMWQDNVAATISAVVYLYAPYRAVDVWVRGALPEAVSFIFYPLIILFLEKYLKTNKKSNLLLFGLSVSLLIINHNLSFILFLPFLVIWFCYQVITLKKLKHLGWFLGVTLLTLGLVAFYVFPVIFEAKYVTLENTIQGYFNFRGHFAGVKQLLFSTNWGYGASVFGPNDDLNISIGFLQWIIPGLTLIYLVVKKKFFDYKEFLVLLFISGVYIFLINNKSIFIWDRIPQMAYIQFPWRFLGVLVFGLSLASGLVVKFIPSKAKTALTFVIIALAIGVNSQYFRPDIWYGYSDSDLLNGELFANQQAASIGDYWPKSAPKMATSLANKQTNEYTLASQQSNQSIYVLNYSQEEVSLPINYFPGWRGYSSNGQKLSTSPDNSGLIKVSNPGDKVTLKFENTKERAVTNLVSLVSLVAFALIFLKAKQYERAH